MSYFYKEKIINTIKNISDGDPFVFKSGNVEVQSETGTSRAIVGQNQFQDNITIKYPGTAGGGGLYRNNPDEPLLEFDSAGNVYITSQFNLGDTVVNGHMKITDIVGDDVVNPAINLIINSDAGAKMWLEANRDGSVPAEDSAYLYLSCDQPNALANRAARFGVNIINGEFDFDYGQVYSNSSGVYNFKSSTMLYYDTVPPVPSSSINLFRMSPTENVSYQNLNMNGNIIDGAAELQVGIITKLPADTYITVSSDIEMSNKDIYVNDVYLKGAFYNQGPANIDVGNSLDLLNTNSVLGCSSIQTGVIDPLATNIIVNGNLILGLEKNIKTTDAYILYEDASGIYTPGSPAPVVSTQVSTWTYNNDLYANNVSKVFNLTSPFYDRGSVTQTLSSITPVTLNTSSGFITTVSLGVATNSATSFIVNNTTITANSLILANIVSYGGAYDTNGLPYVQVSTISAGSFVLVVGNCSNTNNLNGTVKINFVSY